MFFRNIIFVESDSSAMCVMQILMIKMQMFQCGSANHDSENPNTG